MNLALEAPAGGGLGRAARVDTALVGGPHLPFSPCLRLGLCRPAGGSLGPCSARPAPAAQLGSTRACSPPPRPDSDLPQGRVVRGCVWVEFSRRSSRTLPELTFL